MRLNLTIKIVTIVCISMLAGISCSSRKNKIDRKDLIPARELTGIITDMYITDGLMTMPKIHDWYQPKDSLAAYRDVVEKHGYTMDAMTKTLKYYFVKKPKQLVKIYDQALANLTEMEARLEQETNRIQEKESNVWNGKSAYSGPDSTRFDLNIKTEGTFLLSFTATVFPCDESSYPSPVAYTCHPDSAANGRRHYIRTLEYIKDGRPHQYFYNIVLKSNTGTRFIGDLFDPGACTEDATRNMVIEKILLTSVGGR
jgi:hypothetical protein